MCWGEEGGNLEALFLTSISGTFKHIIKTFAKSLCQLKEDMAAGLVKTGLEWTVKSHRMNNFQKGQLCHFASTMSFVAY